MFKRLDCEGKSRDLVDFVILKKLEKFLKIFFSFSVWEQK